MSAPPSCSKKAVKPATWHGGLIFMIKSKQPFPWRRNVWPSKQQHRIELAHLRSRTYQSALSTPSNAQNIHPQQAEFVCVNNPNLQGCEL